MRSCRNDTTIGRTTNVGGTYRCWIVQCLIWFRSVRSNLAFAPSSGRSHGGTHLLGRNCTCASFVASNSVVTTKESAVCGLVGSCQGHVAIQRCWSSPSKVRGTTCRAPQNVCRSDRGPIGREETTATASIKRRRSLVSGNKKVERVKVSLIFISIAVCALYMGFIRSGMYSVVSKRVTQIHAQCGFII